MSNWKGIKNLTRSIIMSFFFYCEISLWFNTQTLFFLCYILACLLYIQHSISLYTIVCIYVFIYLFFPFFLSYMSSKYRIVCEIKKIKQQNKHVIRPRNWRRYSMERQRWEKKVTWHVWSDHRTSCYHWNKKPQQIFYSFTFYISLEYFYF